MFWKTTIEVDIMPDFISDTKLEYHGVNGWYPWFPIQIQTIVLMAV